MRVRRSYTGGTVGTPKNRERRDVDLISDVVELLAARRDHGDEAVEGLVFPGENGNGFLSPTVLLRRHLYPAMVTARDSGAWADAGEADVSQLPAHVREARARERRSDHMALPPSRPFVAQGDDRHLWSLGARGAQAPGREDGGRLSRSDVKAVLNPFCHPTSNGARAQTTEYPFCRPFFDGPGWNRTNDLGIKSPLLYQLSYRPGLAPV